MIPISLTLRGFKGIKAGIGLDEINVDLSSLPEGIVAICGENGRGKTTLLDNLQPFRLMPYKLRKSKDWSPSAFSFYDHCFGSDARKELVFEMAGVRYKALLLIDADRKKQEAYLYMLSGDEPMYGGTARSGITWKPLNDGKSKTFDEAVEQVCGSPGLFFDTVFRAQGAKPLSDLTRSDIMSRLSELLNLDNIRQQGVKCTSVVQQLKARADITRASVASVQRDVEAAAEIESKLAAAEVGLPGFILLRDGAALRLEDAKSNVTALEAQLASQAAVAAQRNILSKQLADEEQRHHTEVLRIDGDIRREKSRLAAATAEQQNVTVTINAKMERAQRIMSGADKIRSAVDREFETNVSLSEAKHSVFLLTNELTSLRSTHAEQSKHLVEASTRLKSATANVSLLDGIDCRGDGSGWVNSSCRFVSAAVGHRDSMTGLESDVEKWRGAVAESDAKISGLSADVKAATDSLSGLEAEVQELLKFSRLLPELLRAEADVAQYTQELSESQDRCHAVSLEVSDRLTALELESAAEFERYASNSEGIRVQLDSIPVSADLSLEVVAARNGVAVAQADVDRAAAAIRALELEVAGYRAQLANVDVKRESLKIAEAEISKLNGAIADFSLLGKALSNDGIIALELDDAAPSISGIVNDLLMSCYGARFSVRLDTQTAKADGGMKEAFDIVVYDSETDSERSITECSGGQISWIEDAITRGISLFNIHRSDRSFGTLFSDEKDGALSPDRKQEFFAVKRKAMEIGTHIREFYITQTSELMDMSDARIVLEPGRVVIC